MKLVLSYGLKHVFINFKRNHEKMFENRYHTRRLRVFENRVFGKTFVNTGVQVVESVRKFHNEKLYIVLSSHTLLLGEQIQTASNTWIY
jgi:hypothetical protein